MESIDERMFTQLLHAILLFCVFEGLEAQGEKKSTNLKSHITPAEAVRQVWRAFGESKPQIIPTVTSGGKI